MAILRLFPLLQLFYQLKQLMVKQDEALHDAKRLPNLLGVLRMEGHGHGGLRSPLEHVLALFIKAGSNGIPLLKRDQQGRHGELS
jgi:hypothetical protein